MGGGAPAAPMSTGDTLFNLEALSQPGGASNDPLSLGLPPGGAGGQNDMGAFFETVDNTDK